MFEPGTFICGCNYWASNAGCHMWHQWDAETVASDFRKLGGELGLQCVRVFPLWPDFQPLTLLTGGGGNAREIAWKEDDELPADGSTLEPEMLQRFRYLCDCAEKNHIKLIVALLTGWMSGRQFVPPALEKLNLFTDPLALYYECRFIEEFIAALKDHPAIIMWEPGNECNCMGEAKNRSEARWWMHAITQSIRASDPGRPVGAGMHGLRPVTPGAIHAAAPWTTTDAGESYDFLTTHPYPAFTQYASTDALGSPKSLTHAAAESRYFSDLGQKPCFAEELGSLAPSNGDEKQVASYMRGVLPELYRQDCLAMLWWCAFDQNHLTRPPYRWCAIERELGLFRKDGSMKPVAREIQKFQKKVARLPFAALPPALREVTVILTDDENSWGAAWGASLLAQKAGLMVQFRREGQSLPDTPLYIIPCMAGWDGITSKLTQELQKRANDGATVLFTYKDAMLSPFGEALGVRSLGHTDGNRLITVPLGGKTLEFNTTAQLALEATDAEILLRDRDGGIVCTRRKHGKGFLAFCSLPVELEAVSRQNGISEGYDAIYRLFTAPVCKLHPLVCKSASCVISFHFDTPKHCWAFITNQDTETVSPDCTLKPGWELESPLPAELEGHDFAIVGICTKNKSARKTCTK